MVSNIHGISIIGSPFQKAAYGQFRASKEIGAARDFCGAFCGA